MESHLKIITALCNFEFQKEELKKLLFEIKNDIEWQKIINVSIEHSVLPSVYENLEKNYKNLLPKKHFLKIKELNQQISLSNINKAKQLINVSQVLTNKGVDIISFKGPLLSALFYGNITKRQYRDIDIIIDKKDFLKTKEALINLGYHPQFNLKNSYEKIYLKAWNYLNFYSNEGFNSLDLHWRSANSNFSFSMEFDGLSENAVEVKIFKNRIKTFSPEINLIYLCQHGCKHGWEKLVWVLDIHKLIENSDGINWGLVLDYSKNSGSLKMLKAGILISNILFNTKLPKDIQEKISLNKDTNDLISKKVDNLLLENSAQKTFFHLSSKDLFYIKTMSSFQDKLLHIISFFKPTPLEWKLGIPTSFYFIYYFYRPIRILKRKLLKK